MNGEPRRRLRKKAKKRQIRRLAVKLLSFYSLESIPTDVKLKSEFHDQYLGQMNSTSESLLIRLKSSQDFQAWSRFVELYTPLLFFWARKTGLQSQDASDLVQDVLSIVHRKMPKFEYESSKSFRGWLRTITLNKHREHQRKKSLKYVDATQSAMNHIADEEQASSIWDLSYRQALVGRAMEMLSDEFQPNTWNALRDYVFSGRPAPEVAAETGLSVWTIYAAKSRLMRRLREELEGLLE